MSYLNYRLGDREDAAEQIEQIYKHGGGEVEVGVGVRNEKALA